MASNSISHGISASQSVVMVIGMAAIVGFAQFARQLGDYRNRTLANILFVATALGFLFWFYFLMLWVFGVDLLPWLVSHWALITLLLLVAGVMSWIVRRRELSRSLPPDPKLFHFGGRSSTARAGAANAVSSTVAPLADVEHKTFTWKGQTRHKCPYSGCEYDTYDIKEFREHVRLCPMRPGGTS